MIHQSYNPVLVFVSILVASLAGFAALDLSSRVADAAGWARTRWIAASAVAMGVGIWSMHFVAMLALRISIPVTYDVFLLVLSIVIAISASAITFTAGSSRTAKPLRLFAASLAMGPAIAGMHYTGMAAMHMPARIDYSIPLVVLSIAIAISASFVALLLARHFRRTVPYGSWLKVLAALPMGAAVYGMHYTGMVAARFYPAASRPAAASDVIATEGLGWAIAAGALVILVLTLMAALADRRLVALRGARARVEAILESALDPIISMDHDGKVIEFNPAAESVFGYTRSETIGRDMAELIIPKRLRDSHRSGLASYNRTGEGPILGKRLELPAMRKDGSELVVELAVTRIPVGDPPIFTGYLRDITERKRTEETLREHTLQLRRLTEAAEAAKTEAETANQAKSEFLAAMSHELRTPLNAIAGYGQLLFEEGLAGPLTDRQKQYLNGILRSQQLLLSLINDVLNFAKLEAGRVEFRTEDLLLDRELKAAMTVVEPLAKNKGLVFDYSCALPPTYVRADRDKLVQIVLNLVSNAVKFTDRGGRVCVSCELCSNGEVGVRVIDTGRGIPGDKHEAIFEPFVQLDRDPTPSAHGTGLGLSISRDLARGMGGDLTVDSEPGRGSTFTLRLQRSTRDRRAVSPESTAETPADDFAALP